MKFVGLTALLFTVASTLILPYVANASEAIDVCAKDETTGAGYKVEANVYKGSELNKRTNSKNYNSFSFYAVIFWAPGDTKVIELDYGDLSFITTANGKDQQGSPWKLWRMSSSRLCY